jgi:hypothetical protein
MPDDGGMAFIKFVDREKVHKYLEVYCPEIDSLLSFWYF